VQLVGSFYTDISRCTVNKTLNQNLNLCPRDKGQIPYIEFVFIQCLLHKVREYDMRWCLFTAVGFPPGASGR